MDTNQLIIGVFAGNMLTVMFLYGAFKASKYERDQDIPWFALLLMLFPMLLAIAGFIAEDGLPGPLSVLTASR